MSLTKATYSMITGAPVNVLDFGAKGDGVTDDTAAIQNALTYTLTTAKHCIFPPGTYITSSLIDLSALPITYNVTISGFGATIKNTTTGVFKFPQLVLSKIEGLTIIGSDSDLATNRNTGSAIWFPNQITLTTLSNLRIKYFAKGIEIPGGLFYTINHCFTSYCGYHLYIGGSAFVNNLVTIYENTFNVSENGSDRVNGYTLTTDVAVFVNDSTGLVVRNNAFEFPQAYGLQLSNIKAASIQNNYFEHGYNGFDINISSSFGRQNIVSTNFHFAGTGNGGTPGGHKPIDVATSILEYSTFISNLIIDFAPENILDNYNKQFIVERVTSRGKLETIDNNILVESNTSNTNLQKYRHYSREFSLGNGATLNVFEIDTNPESRAFIRILLGHARDTSGANQAMSEIFIAITNEADVITSSIQADTKIGTPCTVTLSDSGGDVTVTLNNATGNAVQGNVLMELIYAREGAVVTALI
jgi:hypothetical protein